MEPSLTEARVDFAFLDSGTGGIPYMLDVKRKCPGARCVYLGDTEHFPYGEKPADVVTDCAAHAVACIVRRWNPRALVIACNTISVTALDALRSRFAGLPIVGTVPAIRLAARVTRNKRIGLLATNATVRHPYNARLIADFAAGCRVFSRGDPGLIAFVEHELSFATKEGRLKAVRPAVDYFAANGCDTIILGCTHFTHIAADIATAAGPDVRVVDSRDGVANQALKVAAEAGLHLPAGAASAPAAREPGPLPADCTFFVTALRSPDDATEYQALCRRFAIPWGGVVAE